MRLIYARDQRVGPDPVGYYVYLWRHDEIDRYVGKGANGRWVAHAKPDRNDANQRKYRYFLKHLPEMTCFIIAEGLAAEADVGELEIAEIDLRGLEADGTGTLLNDRRGSVINGPRGRPQGHPTPSSALHQAEAARPFHPERGALARRSCLDRQPEEAGIARGVVSQPLSAAGGDDDGWRIARQRANGRVQGQGPACPPRLGLRPRLHRACAARRLIGFARPYFADAGACGPAGADRRLIGCLVVVLAAAAAWCKNGHRPHTSARR
jgi:hypothetical protein